MELTTHSDVALSFDRPLAPETLGARAITVEYVAPGVEFFGDPFGRIGAELSADRRTVVLRLPELLAGKTFRVLVSERVRAVDGAALAKDPEAPAGAARAVTFRVMELPPP